MNYPLVTGLVVVATASFSQAANADFLGIYAGATLWQSSFVGEVQDGSTQIDIESDLGIDDDDASIFYVALEHPIPVLPNLRVQHTDLAVSGDNELTRSVEFDGVDFNISDQVSSSADLSHTDFTAYWEVVDLVAEFDVGLTGRTFDGSLEIASTTESVAEEFDATIPMLYAKLGFKLPFTGFNANVSLNAIDYSGDSLMDAVARINYEAKFGLGAELGYRVMELDLEDDEFLADLKVDGFFAGVSYHF